VCFKVVYKLSIHQSKEFIVYKYISLIVGLRIIIVVYMKIYINFFVLLDVLYVASSRLARILSLN